MKQKDNYIQLVRGICIICVVIIHTIGFQENEINNYFTIMVRTLVNFTVAVFLAISAYLTNIKKVEEHPKEYIIKRLKRLFFPFIIWSIIYTIVLRKFDFSSLETCLKTIANVLLGTNAAQLYYIVLLLIFNLLTPLLIKVIKSKNRFVNTTLILITPVYLIINFIVNKYGGMNIPYSNNMPFGWLLYYYIGLYLNIKKKLKPESLATVHTHTHTDILEKSCILSIVAICVINILINFIEYKNISFTYAIAQLKFTNMIYILVIIKNRDILKSILYNEKSAINKLLIKIGDYSFGIYLIHILILAIISKLFTLFEINYIIEVIFKCTFTISCSCFTLYWIKKYSNDKLYKYIS